MKYLRWQACMEIIFELPPGPGPMSEGEQGITSTPPPPTLKYIPPLIKWTCPFWTRCPQIGIIIFCATPLVISPISEAILLDDLSDMVMFPQFRVLILFPQADNYLMTPFTSLRWWRLLTVFKKLIFSMVILFSTYVTTYMVSKQVTLTGFKDLEVRDGSSLYPF